MKPKGTKKTFGHEKASFLIYKPNGSPTLQYEEGKQPLENIDWLSPERRQKNHVIF